MTEGIFSVDANITNRMQPADKKELSCHASIKEKVGPFEVNSGRNRSLINSKGFPKGLISWFKHISSVSITA
jgi:hypothetical protein